jgi:GNAT superfamily N-acetyltransferase
VKSLAAALPDEPRWLETRAMLASRYAEVTGGETIESGFVVRVVHGAVSAVAVVGHPPAAAIAQAVAGTTELTPVIAQTSGATHVAEALRSSPQRRRRGNWTSERAILHLREESASCSLPVPAGVRLLTGTESLDHLPAGLRHEITHARGFAPVAAVFIDSRPVSFCYPVWTTERFWDVSIDTLEAYRGQALGARAVSFMIDAMRQQGREPVWGALESNQPSLRLGAKLGFLPMGDIVVFSQGGWVFLSGGFEGA